MEKDDPHGTKRHRQMETFPGPLAKRARFDPKSLEARFVSVVNTEKLDTYIPGSVTAPEDRALICGVLKELVKFDDSRREAPVGSHIDPAVIDSVPKLLIKDYANSVVALPSNGSGPHYYEIHMIFSYLIVMDGEKLESIHQHAPARIPRASIRQYIGMTDGPVPMWHITVRVHSLVHSPPESDLTMTPRAAYHQTQEPARPLTAPATASARLLGLFSSLQ